MSGEMFVNCCFGFFLRFLSDEIFFFFFLSFVFF